MSQLLKIIFFQIRNMTKQLQKWNKIINSDKSESLKELLVNAETYEGILFLMQYLQL